MIRSAAQTEMHEGGAFGTHPALWRTLADAEDSAAYCLAWLALQCSQLDRVGNAMLLLRDPGGTYIPAAVWPDARADVGYLGPLAQRCLAERTALTEIAGGGGALLAAWPLEEGGELCGAVVLDLAPRGDADLQKVWRALHWGAGRIEALLLRRLLTGQLEAQQRAQFTLEMAHSVGEQPRFETALMQIANELAQRLDCERVAVGIERRGRIRLRALSNAATFERRAEFALTLENAMEEACDQGRTVVYPESRGAGGAIAVAHRQAAGSGWICSVAISARGKCIGALTCLNDSPRGPETVAALEAAAALLAPNLELRRELHRWFAGRAVEALRTFSRGMRDPRRLSFRVGAGVVAALLIAFALATGEYRVTGRAVIEGELQRTLVAPFDGFIVAAEARAGQRVVAGDLLASLDDRDLRLDQQKWLAQSEQAERKYRDALAKRDAPNARILAAQLAEAQAQVALVADKLARARIVAPFDGVLVSGDLSQMLGAPVERGRSLFELAPLDAYRVILKVPERAIRDVRIEQRGVIVLAGRSGEQIPFTVQNIGMAVAEDGANVFRIEAGLEDDGSGLRPGMEGVGKIAIGERRLLWIWTHAFFDWLHIKLWYWLP